MDVVAALLRRGDEIFICRRPPGKKRGGLWEFPGGKPETGESAEEALKRECREELGIEIKVGRLFAAVTHAYPEVTIRLSVYEAETDDEPQLLEHTEAKWVTPGELSDYAFCPADEDILALLREKDGMRAKDRNS